MPDQVMSDNSQIVKVLQGLATVCRDSQEGYRAAAEQTTDGELKALFEEFAAGRGRDADELDRQIREQGGEPPARGGSLAGQAHRMFVALRAALSRNDRAAPRYRRARSSPHSGSGRESLRSLR